MGDEPLRVAWFDSRLDNTVSEAFTARAAARTPDSPPHGFATLSPPGVYEEPASIVTARMIKSARQLDRATKGA